MNLSDYDIFSFQIFHYLVKEYDYRIVRVEEHKDDIWLINAKQNIYPLIRLSSKENAGTRTDFEYIRNVHRIIVNLIHREAPVLILNTHPNCTPMRNALIVQIKVLPNDISNPEILSVFPKLDTIVHPVEDGNLEIIQLMKEIEEIQKQRESEIVEKTKRRLKPSATMIVMGLCIVYFILAMVMFSSTGNYLASMIASGAYYKMNVVAAHEYWRLLTAGFLHGDIISLALMMYVLFQTGKLCEPLFRKRDFITILLLSIVCGNACMLIGAVNTCGFGIGAGIWGITGAYYAVILQNKTYRHPMVKMAFVKTISWSLCICLLPGISIMGHLGGMVTGFLLGILYHASQGFQSLRTHATISVFLLVIGIFFLGSQTRDVQPVEKTVDAQIVKIFEDTPLDFYAQYLKRCYNKQYEME